MKHTCPTCGSNLTYSASRKRGRGILNLEVEDLLKDKRKRIRMVDIVNYINSDSDYRPACARSIRETPSWIKYNKRIQL